MVIEWSIRHWSAYFMCILLITFVFHAIFDMCSFNATVYHSLLQKCHQIKCSEIARDFFFLKVFCFLLPNYFSHAHFHSFITRLLLADFTGRWCCCRCSWCFLHHEDCSDEQHKRCGQKINRGGSIWICNTDVTLFNKWTINHVNNSIGANHISAEHINLLVLPSYRISWWWRGRRNFKFSKIAQ